MKSPEYHPANSPEDWNQEPFPIKDREEWKKLKERITDQAALKELGDSVLYQFYLALDDLKEKSAFLRMNHQQRTEFMIRKQQEDRKNRS